MKCSGKTIFSARPVHTLYFYTYMDNSIGITLCENKDGNPFTPFCTPTLPAYESPSIGKAPEHTIYVRDYGMYEDAISVLIDEGVVVPNSVRKLRDGIISAQITTQVYEKYIASNPDILFIPESS